MNELLKAIVCEILMPICDIKAYYITLTNGKQIMNFQSYCYINEEWFNEKLSEKGLNEYFKIIKTPCNKSNIFTIFKLEQIKQDDTIVALYKLTGFKL